MGDVSYRAAIWLCQRWRSVGKTRCSRNPRAPGNRGGPVLRQTVWGVFHGMDRSENALGAAAGGRIICANLWGCPDLRHRLHDEPVHRAVGFPELASSPRSSQNRCLVGIDSLRDCGGDSADYECSRTGTTAPFLVRRVCEVLSSFFVQPPDFLGRGPLLCESP